MVSVYEVSISHLLPSAEYSQRHAFPSSTHVHPQSLCMRFKKTPVDRQISGSGHDTVARDFPSIEITVLRQRRIVLGTN